MDTSLRKALFALLAGALLALAGCASDLEPTGSNEPTILDANGDGVPDGYDDDGDGVADGAVAGLCSLVCDGGVLVGIDFNCDGEVDIELDGVPSPVCDGDGGGGGGGGGNVNECVVQVNNLEISCSAVDGGPYTCECKQDGQVVNTCTTDSPNACSIPNAGGCCF